MARKEDRLTVLRCATLNCLAFDATADLIHKMLDEILNGSTEIPTPPASQATQAPTTDECSSISNASSEAVDKGQQAPTSEEISPPKLNDELVEESIVAAAKSEDPLTDTSSPKITSEHLPVQKEEAPDGMDC